MSGLMEALKRLWANNLGILALVVIIALAGAYLALVEASRPHVGGDELRFDQFVTLAEQDRIGNAEILDEDSYVIGSYRTDDGSERPYNTPYLKANNTR